MPPSPTPRLAINSDFPDPSIVLDQSSDAYYSFATNNGQHHVQIAAKFRDEAEWQVPSLEPLTGDGPWGVVNNIWAPDAVHIDSSNWVLYYSAPAAADEGKHCVGAATSSSGPSGAYSPRDEYISCDLDAGGAIDPSGYYDEATNTRWVVYKIDGNSLGGGGPCGNEGGSHSTPIMLQEASNTVPNQRSNHFI